MVTRSKNNIFRPKHLNSVTTQHPSPSPIKPTRVFQAIKSLQWRGAMDDKLNALLRNQTWDLVLAASALTSLAASGL